MLSSLKVQIEERVLEELKESILFRQLDTLGVFSHRYIYILQWKGEHASLEVIGGQ